MSHYYKKKLEKYKQTLTCTDQPQLKTLIKEPASLKGEDIQAVGQQQYVVDVLQSIRRDIKSDMTH